MNNDNKMQNLRKLLRKAAEEGFYTYLADDAPKLPSWEAFTQTAMWSARSLYEAISDVQVAHGLEGWPDLPSAIPSEAMPQEDPDWKAFHWRVCAPVLLVDLARRGLTALALGDAKRARETGLAALLLVMLGHLVTPGVVREWVLPPETVAAALQVPHTEFLEQVDQMLELATTAEYPQRMVEELGELAKLVQALPESCQLPGPALWSLREFARGTMRGI